MDPVKIMRYRPTEEGLGRWLGPLEAVIMEAMWAAERTRTVLQMQGALRNEGVELAYTTIMTTMARLAKKGLLQRRRQGLAYVYFPTSSMTEFVEFQERAIRASLTIAERVAA